MSWFSPCFALLTTVAVCFSHMANGNILQSDGWLAMVSRVTMSGELVSDGMSLKNLQAGSFFCNRILERFGRLRTLHDHAGWGPHVSVICAGQWWLYVIERKQHEAIQDNLCRRQTAAHYALGDFVMFWFPSTSKKCFVVAIEVLFVFLLRISTVIAYFLSRCSSDAVVIFVEITATLLNWYCTHVCFMTSKFFRSIVFFPVLFVVLSSPRCLCSQPSANHLEKSSQAEEFVRGDSAM